MHWLARLLRRPSAEALHREIDEELRVHLSILSEELEADGWPPHEARLEAERRFGSVDHLRRACLAQHGIHPTGEGDSMIVRIWQDIRLGVRGLVRQPAFTLTAIVTLALGMGANTAVFSVVKAVLLTPPPYPDPDRLVMIWETRPDLPRMSIAYPNYEDWRRQSDTLAELAIYRRTSVTVGAAGEPQRIEAAQVSANLFAALGVTPALGRAFQAEDDRPGAPRVTMVGHGLWESRFGAREDVLGETLLIDDVPYTVVGVLPQGFSFPSRVQAYVPIGLESGDPGWNNRGNHPAIFGVARLAPGVRLTEARAEMDQIAAALARAYPVSNQSSTITLTPLADVAVGDARPPLIALSAAVVVVLLVACANLATLLLGRGQARRHELSVRAAMGGTRSRLVSQLLAESVVLAGVGALAGALLAALATPALLALFPGVVPSSTVVAFDVPVLVFTGAVAVFAGLMFGVVPAWQLTRGVTAALTERAGTGAPRARLAQALLVVAQVAAAMVLMTGAGLLTRSMVSVLDQHPGFDAEGVHTFRLTLPARRYPEHTDRARAIDQLLQRVGAVPSATGVAVTTNLPLVDGSQTSIYARDNPPADMNQRPLVEFSVVSPGYFQTMGIPVISGRTFGPEDRTGGPQAAVVDESFASTFWPGQDPIGREIVRGQEDVEANRVVIVGVVGSVRYRGLDRPSPRPQMYFVHRQRSEDTLTLLVRSPLSASAVAGSVRQAILEVDPRLPVEQAAELADAVSGSMSSRQFSTALLLAFALLAALLAAVGLYGVISLGVSERRREFGVRLALGATPPSLSRLVVGRGLSLAAAGIGLGLLGALAGTRLLDGLLYGVTALDPLTYMGVGAGLALVAMAASLAPAWRAANVDPATSLR